MPKIATQDVDLIRSLNGSQPARAWDAFVKRVANTVWQACVLLVGDEAEARLAFKEVMDALQANRFERLSIYNGTSSLDTFVAILARDILSIRLVRLFQHGSEDKGWKAFEVFFGPRIKQIITRRISGVSNEELRQDAYQDVCLALIKDDYRRIRAYTGQGSFTGFILQTVDRLVIDFIRRPTQTGPNHGAAARLHDSDDVLNDMASDQPNPEQALLTLQSQNLLSAAALVLHEASATMSEAERLYIEITLSSGDQMPAREIARRMGRPVDDIYKLKQRVMTQLRSALSSHPTVKSWRASV